MTEPLRGTNLWYTHGGMDSEWLDLFIGVHLWGSLFATIATFQIIHWQTDRLTNTTIKNRSTASTKLSTELLDYGYTDIQTVRRMLQSALSPFFTNVFDNYVLYPGCDKLCCFGGIFIHSAPKETQRFLDESPRVHGSLTKGRTQWPRGTRKRIRKTCVFILAKSVVKQ